MEKERSMLLLKDFKSIWWGLEHHQIRELNVSWLRPQAPRVTDLFIFDIIV